MCQCTACQEQWLAQFSIEQRPKAQEALRLLRDAQTLLRRADDIYRIQTTHAFFTARGTLHGIEVDTPQGTHLIPTLRQQSPNASGHCLALADYVAPTTDRIGLFAVAIHELSIPTDLYQQMLQQTLADRLAEATSEYLHHTLLEGRGIRPAVGYPSLPDQSLLFDFDRLLNLSQIGITLTETGAMHPHAAVCGMYITHPKARYFMVGNITAEQLEQYATLRGKTPDEMAKYITPNV